jgi:hypothetical protein
MFRVWRWTKIVLLVFVLTGFFSGVQAQERPNVLIFIADDISYNDFGCYGRTKKFLYLVNGLPESDNRGAIDIMGGAAGVELKLGWQAQGLNAPQQQIFLRPQPAREFYYCVKDSLQLNNLLADEKEFRFADDLNKLAKALGVWKRETADSQPPNLTPDWYGREDCAKLPAHGKRGTMPGADKNAEKVNKSGPF